MSPHKMGPHKKVLFNAIFRLSNLRPATRRKQMLSNASRRFQNSPNALLEKDPKLEEVAKNWTNPPKK